MTAEQLDGRPEGKVFPDESIELLGSPKARDHLRTWIIDSVGQIFPELKGVEPRPFPRRCMHFIPANRPDFFTQAPSLGADTIILDLEDSLPLQDKPQARRNIMALDRNIFPGQDAELCVRINNLSHPNLKEDIEVVRKVRPDSIFAPKVRNRKDLEQLKELLGEEFEIIPIIETIEGWLHAEEIISFPGVRSVCFGAEDFYADLSRRFRQRKGDIVDNPADRDRYMEFVRPLILFCTYHDVQFLDSVHTLFRDPAGGNSEALIHLRRECALMRQKGALGKISIHPSQIPVIQKEFDIKPEEVREAVEKLLLFQNTAVTVDTSGNMQDTPEAVAAIKILTDALRYL